RRREGGRRMWGGVGVPWKRTEMRRTGRRMDSKGLAMREKGFTLDPRNVWNRSPTYDSRVVGINRKLESNSSTHDERVSCRGAEKDVITFSQCVCLLSSIKLRLAVETVNYVIIAGREVTPGSCVSLYGFPKITCRKFIDFVRAAAPAESTGRAAVEFNRRHRPRRSGYGASDVPRDNVQACRRAGRRRSSTERRESRRRAPTRVTGKT
ncbi:hypothetical protein X777_05634, partial [Ooceraea biroi]